MLSVPLVYWDLNLLLAILQVAYRYMQCVQALSEGPLPLDEHDMDITLEDLSDCYGVQYSDELSGEVTPHTAIF